MGLQRREVGLGIPARPGLRIQPDGHGLAEDRQRLIAELKNRGLKVWCWTVNDPPIMEALMRWGVQSITTDRVDVLVKLREKLRGEADRKME